MTGGAGAKHDSDGGSEVGGLRMAAALDLQPVVDQQQDELARQRWNRLIARYLDRVEGEGRS